MHLSFTTMVTLSVPQREAAITKTLYLETLLNCEPPFPKLSLPFTVHHNFAPLFYPYLYPPYFTPSPLYFVFVFVFVFHLLYFLHLPRFFPLIFLLVFFNNPLLYILISPPNLNPLFKNLGNKYIHIYHCWLGESFRRKTRHIGGRRQSLELFIS